MTELQMQNDLKLGEKVSFYIQEELVIGKVLYKDTAMMQVQGDYRGRILTPTLVYSTWEALELDRHLN